MKTNESVPVNWHISSDRKKKPFFLMKEIFTD